MPSRIAPVVIVLIVAASAQGVAAKRHPVPKEHPRLLGSAEELRALAKRRPVEYQRVVQVAKAEGVDDHSKVISLGLVAVIERDAAAARQAKHIAMKYVAGPIRQGHVTFGHDLALCALAYDLAYPAWSDAERDRFHDYMNKTVDANVDSETSVFHNAWYAYKNWGIGLACYASYYENPRAKAILHTLDEDYRTRAAPALRLSGDGGGFAEGYYVHYWLYEWLFFCEVARRCEGVDYYALAPEFYSRRAVASMFEMYPGKDEYGTRRPIPMGDGGGRLFGGDRDKVLAARRILANYYRDDPEQAMVHAFNETTPRSGVGNYAYKDFLWHDTDFPKADLAQMRLSHYSPGPGYVYARSSWNDDATYFFFKCGDRFTAHQHLDVGHFLIFRHAELAGDGGHYNDFGGPHDVNYHLRTIAHNTILVLDPAETWPNVRGRPAANDGGQAHNWRHHNGAFHDPDDWKKQYPAGDIADMLAFEDRHSYVYMAGDCTRAYSPKKLQCFTRQIVYLRPGTFVIFDRVKSTNPQFQKTWLLQAMAPPTGAAPNLVVTNGRGRLFIQTLLPESPRVKLCEGEELYRYGGQSYPPTGDTGPAPQCRIEISPSVPAAEDFFLHVLTATDANVETAPAASVKTARGSVAVTVDGTTIAFTTAQVGGTIERGGRRVNLARAERGPHPEM